jgi:uncharacterized protein YcaQ
MREGVFWCTRCDNEFVNFYRHVSVVKELDDGPFYEVKVAEEQKVSGQYWAWWSNKDDMFETVYHKRVLVMVYERHGFIFKERYGHGRILPVKVTVIGGMT